MDGLEVIGYTKYMVYFANYGAIRLNTPQRSPKSWGFGAFTMDGGSFLTGLSSGVVARDARMICWLSPCVVFKSRGGAERSGVQHNSNMSDNLATEQTASLRSREQSSSQTREPRVAVRACLFLD